MNTTLEQAEEQLTLQQIEEYMWRTNSILEYEHYRTRFYALKAKCKPQVLKPEPQWSPYP